MRGVPDLQLWDSFANCPCKGDDPCDKCKTVYAEIVRRHQESTKEEL